MGNPWLDINLNDYENHMSYESVMQMQALREIMSGQFSVTPNESIMVLGVAGGNGLEGIDTQATKTVYGVDINPDFLRECAARFPFVTAVQADLMDENAVLPQAQLLIANLLVEFIGYLCFCKAVKKINPQSVSCVIQADTDDSFVSETPYMHLLDRLDEVHNEMDGDKLTDAMKSINYRLTYRGETALPNGKKLVRLDYIKGE